LEDTRADLANLSRAQNEKANADAAGVFLLGIPFSKLSGDYEGEIARLKGQVEAIETAQTKKKCPSSAAGDVGTASSGQAPASESRMSSADAQGQLQVLQDLRGRGLLTEAEFEAKRKALADAVLVGVDAAAAAPARLPIVGARVKLRDEDPISHAKIGEVVLTIDSVSENGTMLNGGAIVLDRTGNLTTGTLPSPHVAGLGGNRLRSTRSATARLVPTPPMQPVDLDVKVLRAEATRVAGRDMELARCAVSGYAPSTIVAGVGLMNSAAGARIAGEILVEPASGLVLWADIRSVNTFYAVSRRALAPDAP